MTATVVDRPGVSTVLTPSAIRGTHSVRTAEGYTESRTPGGGARIAPPQREDRSTGRSYSLGEHERSRTTATVVARRSGNGCRFVLCELLEKLDAAWEITQADPCRSKSWPMAEVYRIVGPLSLIEMSELTRFPARTICRWNQAGAVPDRSSDALAVALGLHPANVWPEWVG